MLISGLVAACCQVDSLSSRERTRKPFWDDLGSFVDRVFDDGRMQVGRAFDEIKEGVVGLSGIRIGEDKDKGIYRIEVALPGYEKDDLAIEIERRSEGLSILTIKAGAKKEKKSEEKDDKSVSKSWYYGSRSAESKLTLPSYVDPESSEVSYEDGVLVISFKMNEAEKTKVIKLSVD